MHDTSTPDVEYLGRTPFLGEEGVERYRFKNGLTLLFVRDTSAPVFSYQTWFRVGARDDTEGISGIAHLFEHMMFKATENRTDGEFMQLLEAAGAPDVNAWTWSDETVYLQSLPRGNLDLIAGLEADRMMNLRVDERTFETERQVVINEWRLRVENDPYGLLNERLWNLAFETHPYGRPVIGWRPDLDAITVEDCQAFYRTFYSPSNATLILVGDMEAGEVVDTLAKHYGSLHAQEIRRPEVRFEPEQTAYRTEEIPLSAETEILMAGIKIPETRHPDHAALLLLDRILFGGRSSRLYRKLVDQGRASRVNAVLPLFQDPSLYDITVILRPGRQAREAEAILFEEFADLAARPVNDEELSTARNKVKASLYGDLKETRGKADFLGIFEVAAGNFQMGLQILEAVEALDAEQLREAAARHLRRDRTSSAVGVPSRPGAASGPLPAGGPTGHRPFGFDGAPRPTPTPGGGRIFTVPESSPPLVRISTLFQVGSFLDPPGQEGLTYLTGKMLIRGTRTLDKDRLEATVDGLGGSLVTQVGFERLGVGGETLAETQAPFFDVLESVLTEPTFPEAELSKLKDETRAHIVEMRNNDRALGILFHEKHLFGDHPYGRLTLGSTASLEAITRSDLVEYHRKYMGENSILAGVAGAVDPAVVEARILRLLEGLGRKEAPEAAGADRPVLEDRRLVVVDKPDRSQTYVRIGHFGVTYDDPDFPALDLANTIFGGSNFNAILFNEIREKRGWSYGVGSAFKVAKHPHTFSMAFSPAVKDTVSAIHLALQLFERFVQDGVTPEALEFARRYTLGTSAFDRTTPEKRLRLAMEQAIFGFDRAAHLEAVRTLELGDIEAAVRRHLDPQNLLVTVVCTAADLRDPLEKSGMFRGVEVVPYDAIG